MRRLSVCALLLACSSLCVRAAERPNILFLFTDDHSTHAVSCYGSSYNKTPAIDRIAAEGMRFDRCLVTNSICAPSRAVILTGKYSHVNGQRTNSDTFDGSQQTMPKLMQEAGYTTAIIGKWHLKSTPTGFDHFEVLRGQGSYYNPMLITNGERIHHEGYTTDIITDRTIEWLENRDRNKPFMLMSQHKAPHGRWEPALRHLSLYDDVEIPEPPTLFDDYSGRASAASNHAMGLATHMGDHRLMFKYSSTFTAEQFAKFDGAFRPKNEAFSKMSFSGDDETRWNYQRYIKNYLRCVTAVDENIGRLLDYLDSSGLAKNTVVMYSSDQGFYLGEHGWFDKRWMYEESLRAPLVVRWPGLKPGRVNRKIVSNVDFAPTFLDIAGSTIPGDMHGQSLAPWLREDTFTGWRESFYYHYYESGGHGVPIHYGVATDQYKLIHYPETNEWELFDRKTDPREMQSVYDSPDYGAVRKRLKGELNTHRQQLGVDA